MDLLLLSNSTMPGEPFLQWPREHIASFLGDRKRIAFVPFAAVSFSMDSYADMVQRAWRDEQREVIAVHRAEDPTKALSEAEAIAVGGGNTFQLLRMLYRTNLLRAIADRVKNGMPFLGWSAGSNVAGPTIMTTNDMPIAEPPSFFAMHLVPFQINPHYTEAVLEGHGGESRDQRIAEFLTLHPKSTVVGLREGAALRVNGEQVGIIGRGMRVLRHGCGPVEVEGGRTLRRDLRDVDNSPGRAEGGR
jgi:dipeptidase E